MSYDSKTFNANGTFKSGQSVEFEYDKNGRVISQTIQDYQNEEFTLKGEREEKINFKYDQNGNLSSYESRIYNVDQTFKTGTRVEFEYDDAGRVTKQTIQDF